MVGRGARRVSDPTIVRQDFLDLGELDRLCEYAVKTGVERTFLFIHIGQARDGDEAYGGEGFICPHFLRNIKSILFAGQAKIAKNQIRRISPGQVECRTRSERHIRLASHDVKKIAKQPCQVLIIFNYKDAYGRVRLGGIHGSAVRLHVILVV
jgi:hypothetical protein